jgi:3-dehydroquinate synthetase
MAEIIKAALICDKIFFDCLMNYSVEFLIKNHDVLKKVIETSMKIKLSIVNEDKLEGN